MTNKNNDALLMAARYGNQFKIIAALNSEADINATDVDGGSALFYEVIHGENKIISILIAAGNNIDLEDKYSVTAVELADDICRSLFIQCIQELKTVEIDILSINI